MAWRQGIIWTNYGLVYWRYSASLSYLSIAGQHIGSLHWRHMSVMASQITRNSTRGEREWGVSSQKMREIRHLSTVSLIDSLFRLTAKKHRSKLRITDPLPISTASQPMWRTSFVNTSLEKVKRPTMYVSRMKSIDFEVFKSLHNCSPSYITDMFRISATPYDTRDGTKLIQPKVNTTRNGFKSFRYQGAKIWNELPTSIKNTEDVSEFKYRLNEWPGPVCKCVSCDVCKFKNI